MLSVAFHCADGSATLVVADDGVGLLTSGGQERPGALGQRLVAALAMVMGWEALIVQRDVCGLSTAEGEALSVWAARAFLHETLREIEASGAGASPARRPGRPPRG